MLDQVNSAEGTGLLARRDTAAVERRKLKIDIIIQSAHVAVTEPQDLQIEWRRAGKSVRTKKQTVDHQLKEPKFKDRFTMSSGFKFDAVTQTYLPDISELTLYCEGKKVGTCTVDLASYIDKKAEQEKAMMGDMGDH